MDCQVVHICDCFPARIRCTLAELPETLDETYEITLRGINKANWVFAHRMFQFVSVASRPLRVEELAELLAFNFEAGSIPEYYEDWRLEHPVNAVLSTCSTLLAIVNDGGSTVVQFSHLSVKEFLTSTRIAKATDTVSRYHVSMTPAHTLVAQACLGILLHLDNDVTSDSLGDFPLAGYAAEHWVDHARFGDVSGNVEDGMKQLFDPSKPHHLSICVWICDPAVSTRERRTRSKTPPPLFGTSLHCAASWGLHTVVEFLITEHLQDVCSRDFTDNATPLHLASRNGHVKAAHKLIDHRADLTAQDDNGWTPLHLASQEGEVDVARMLIERGADLKAQDHKGWSPLHVASHQGEVNVARMLIEHGADLKAQNNDGWTQLHLALQVGEVDVARMLIERGADLSVQDNDGWTPLHLASYWGRVDVVHMLIENGADLEARNNDEETPLHLASASTFRDENSPQKYVEVVNVLLKRGADVNARNNHGFIPYALAEQDSEIMRVLAAWMPIELD